MGIATKLAEKFSKDKRFRLYVGAIAVIGIALIAICWISDSKKIQVEPVENSNQEYIEMIEHKVTQLVGRVEGVGRAEVVITLATDTQYVYATEETVDSNSKSGQNETQNNNSKKRNYVITRQTDGSEQPLITTVMQPEIRGVVVVCDGASDAATRARLTELISVALDIGYNKICITKMSSE